MIKIIVVIVVFVLFLLLEAPIYLSPRYYCRTCVDIYEYAWKIIMG